MSTFYKVQFVIKGYKTLDSNIQKTFKITFLSRTLIYNLLQNGPIILRMLN